MPAKILLYIAKQQTIMGLWQHGAVSECHILPNDESGLTAFAGYLKKHQQQPLHLMIDTVDEEYRTEVLPHATGKTRHAMLQRKLLQTFHGTPFVVAQYQGRSEEKRRDDHFLLAALTKTESLQPWLDIIQAQAAPLQGVYLLPVISEWLLPQLGIAEDNLLLVTRHVAGLRQSFFSGGRLKLSRLTSLEREEDGDFTLYAEEIEKTRFYLNSLRLLPRNQPLTVYLLDYETHLEPLAESLKQDPALRCIVLGKAEITRKLKLNNTRCTASAIVPHLMALARFQPEASLAPAELLRPYRLHRLQQALYLAAGGVLLSGLAMSGINYWNTQGLEQKQSAMAQQTAQLAQQYDQIARSFPRTPVKAEELRTAVETVEKLRLTRHTPEAFMQMLSRALAKHTDVQINRVHWQTGSASASTGTRPPAGATAAHSGDIEAELAPFRGDYRAALQQIQSFASTLRAMPAVAEVSITKLPLNIDPTAALRGTTQDKIETGGASGFNLHIVLKETS